MSPAAVARSRLPASSSASAYSTSSFIASSIASAPSSSVSSCTVLHLLLSNMDATEVDDDENDDDDDDAEREYRKEAEQLLKRANELRSTIPNIKPPPPRVLPETETTDPSISRMRSSSSMRSMRSSSSRIDDSKGRSKWQVVPRRSCDDDANDADDGVGYRLELDIGREDGTWMDPRWGASGKRIELTLDVFFRNALATDDEAAMVMVKKKMMVQENVEGGIRSSSSSSLSSSSVLILETATVARLRQGFDSMKCEGGGAYRIDGGGRTAQFYVSVEGTPERGSSYGDIFIPRGLLYFSIPCFGSVSRLSSKEGIVTVRQVGWHTGWRRNESRIVGTVRAVPIEKAIQRDGF